MFSALQSYSQLDTSADPSHQERLDALVSAARRRHGELADRLVPVLTESRRQGNITARRNEHTDSAVRYFLGLLLNIPSRKEILAMLQDSLGGDPRAHLRVILRKLAKVDTAGSLHFLDVEIAPGPGAAEAYTSLLVGCVDAIVDGLPETDTLRRLREVAPAEIVESQADGIRDLLAALRNPLSAFAALAR